MWGTSTARRKSSISGSRLLPRKWLAKTQKRTGPESRTDAPWGSQFLFLMAAGLF
jgi:hypothetical protein